MVCMLCVLLLTNEDPREACPRQRCALLPYGFLSFFQCLPLDVEPCTWR